MGGVIEIKEMAELPAEELTSILRQGAILRLPFVQTRIRRPTGERRQ